jgi:hypothetical protein
MFHTQHLCTNVHCTAQAYVLPWHNGAAVVSINPNNEPTLFTLRG